MVSKWASDRHVELEIALEIVILLSYALSQAAGPNLVAVFAAGDLTMLGLEQKDVRRVSNVSRIGERMYWRPSLWE